ncbi:MAG: choice-of-anchor I family protein [Piscinibacter sp.]|uniref:choice-of-anchor I family protein n=1 Tax=Piscinibacter sp. TaxID=1903157 RepID=UPI00258A676A|nr:choice-of-anchor I family protein [Piscinibacter sp.]MCW5666392.1 choice-of-anchor I family protein [Piscinibacter sp.]
MPLLHRPAPLRALAFTAALLAAPFARADALGAERVWQYAHQAATPGQKAEIVAYDKRTDTLWVAGVLGIDVLDRASGSPLAHIALAHLGAVNSVAIHRGLAAVAIENTLDRTLPGVVVFYDTRSRRQLGAPVPVGALPDMLAFTPDGRRLLVANEATPNPRPAPAGQGTDDPTGSVSIVDVHSRRVTTLAIEPSLPGYDRLRLFPAAGTLPTQPAAYSPYGPEPEYIAVDPNGQRAYVTLQEANGIAVLDLRRQRFEKILPLGLKDFSRPGNEIDPNDQDGEIRLRSVGAFGLYQPDAIAAYTHRGRSYLLMANEGDARDNGSGDGEDERRGAAGNAAIEYVPDGSELGRLTFSNVDSARGGPLVAFGARSFSIRTTDGELVFDSGSALDREAIRLGLYDDGRSDNKGVEPEGVAVLRVGGRTLAFVGLERTLKSVVVAWDVTDPRDVRPLGTIVGEGDVSPEGLTAFRAGRHVYVAVANEVSDTTSLFRLALHCDDEDDDADDDADEGDRTE